MRLRFGSLLVVMALNAAIAFAQGTTQLNGTVTDPTGAAVPNANIELQNTDTGLKRSTSSDASGNYLFAQTAPGNYSLSVQASGFSATTVNNIRLLVNTPATVAVKLEVGQVSETVSVTAEALQVNTTDASIGNSFGSKPILQLPFEGRNVVGLLSLQPGVSFAGENLTNSYRGGNVMGGKNDQANVTLDGVDVNDQQNRDPFTSVLRVTLDSVQEFRVTTTNANPDQGRSSGAQVALVTKSGTNQFHGSAYEFLRNKKTNANSFFNNLSGLPLAKLNRNVFGASLGGPIQKNRMFFFGNYEGRKDRTEAQAIRTIPTETLRQGIVRYIRTDGSIATLTAADMRTRIDPLAIGPSQNALAVMQQYPLPNTTVVGDSINTSGFIFNAPTTVDNNTYIAKLDFLLDNSSKHVMFLRGNLQDDKSTSAPQFPGMAPNNTGLNNSKGLATGLTSALSARMVNNFRYGLTRVGREDTGVSLLPFVTFRTMDPLNGNNRPFIRKTPVHTVADDFSWMKGKHELKFGFVSRFIRNNRLAYGNSFHSASTNSSWLVSSGAELNRPLTDIRSTAINAYRDAAMAALGVVSQGNASYNYNKDGSPLATGAGVPRQFNAEEYEFYGQDTWRVTRALTVTYGLRWSLMPPVYEANGVQTVSRQPLSNWFADRSGAADLGAPQSIVQPVEYILKEQPGGRDLYPYHKKNFAPRVAVAYSPQGTGGLSRFLFGGPGKTAIRAGWGMYYDLMGAGLITNYDVSALGLSTSITNPSATLSLSNAPRFQGLNSIPNGLLVPAPPAGFPQKAPNVFAITNSLDDVLLTPYTMNPSFSVSREFSGGWFVQGSYVGRFSRRSLMSEDIAMPTNYKDQASGVRYFEAATLLARQALAETPVANVQPIPFWENLYGNIAGGGLTATQRVYQRYLANAPDYTYALYELDVLCRPGCSKFGQYTFYNPQYSYLRTLRSTGSGSYHGMLWTVRKRFTSGDDITFNYTFSKSIDLASTPENSTGSQGVVINSFNRGLFRAVSDYDARHQVNATWVYGLPFGKGRKFADRGGLTNAVIGGWQLSGLWRMSSGLPISIGNGRFWPTNWNITGYATQIGQFADGTNKNAGAPPGGTGGANIFQNPAEAVKAFEYSLPGAVGGRNNVRGDGNFNMDMGLGKTFAMPYREGHTLQFRWEVFNVTNTARFDPFSISGTLGTLGSFGKYSDTLTLPRVMQFSLRYDF
ncbi:MAG: carboxypeptidase-like regulatory domain-containing protein [Bryobacteraceae bacterium]